MVRVATGHLCRRFKSYARCLGRRVLKKAYIVTVTRRRNRLSPDRVQFDDSLSSADISALIDDADVRVLQTSEPVRSKTWIELNARFFSARPDVQLRVFGFYSSVCDLSFLWTMDKVQDFSADCLRRAQNIEAITRMPSLRRVGIGVFELESFDFLADLPPEIEAIYLGATRSKKPSLRPLELFRALRELNIEGHRKDVEVIGSLNKLEDLTLRSVSVSDFSFLRGLSKLWSLDIKLGGSNDLRALAGLENIKYLELWQVRGLADLHPISTLTGLQYLFLQSLPRVTSLPELGKLIRLRRVHLDNMKGLRSLEALCGAPMLEELVHFDAKNHAPADYECLLKSKTMKALRVGFGSDSKNNAFRAMLDSHQKVWHDLSQFEFQA